MDPEEMAELGLNANEIQTETAAAPATTEQSKETSSETTTTPTTTAAAAAAEHPELSEEERIERFTVSKSFITIPWKKGNKSDQTLANAFWEKHSAFLYLGKGTTEIHQWSSIHPWVEGFRGKKLSLLTWFPSATA